MQSIFPNGAPLPLLLGVAAVIAYFCGCFNGAVIVSKYILRDDVRNHGSGNAGLTNFFRTFGGPLTFVVILCDVLKAVAAIKISVWLGGYFDPRIMPDTPMENQALLLVLFKYWGGLFCLLGHMFPCMFHFKGGKGILSGGTIAIMIDWRIAVVVWGGFPFISWYCYPQTPIIVLAFCLGGLIVWKHRANIQRLLAGNENKLSFHRKKT